MCALSWYIYPSVQLQLWHRGKIWRKRFQIGGVGAMVLYPSSKRKAPVNEYLHLHVFYLPPGKKSWSYSMENNKTKKKANYQVFWLRRRYICYSLCLKKWGGCSTQRQNVCIFKFRIKTLQTAVSSMSLRAVCFLLPTICCVQCVSLFQ